MHAIVARHRDGDTAYIVLMLIQVALNLVQRFLETCLIPADRKERVSEGCIKTGIVVVQSRRRSLQARAVNVNDVWDLEYGLWAQRLAVGVEVCIMLESSSGIPASAYACKGRGGNESYVCALPILLGLIWLGLGGTRPRP
jgi:hypothetical protein